MSRAAHNKPGQKPKPPKLAGDPMIPNGFRRYLIDFLAHLEARNFSPHTLRHRRIDLGYFITWCEARAVNTPQDVHRAILERYRQHLAHTRRAKDDQPISFGNQLKQLIALRTFFQWMAHEHHLLSNPAAELVLPKVEKRLPRHLLSITEVEAVLARPDLNAPLGLRDRAILETLYTTAIRRQELINLTLPDLNLEAGLAMIRQGKGKKDRMVPVGDRACRWLVRYLAEVRPLLAADEGPQVVFLTKLGHALSPNRLSEMVNAYVRDADLDKGGSCHALRHACATHMLEAGADIRYLQQLLGHEHLDTTAIYTRVSITKLKAVHDKTHPARLKRSRGDNGDDSEVQTTEDV